MADDRGHERSSFTRSASTGPICTKYGSTPVAQQTDCTTGSVVPIGAAKCEGKVKISAHAQGVEPWTAPERSLLRRRVDKIARQRLGLPSTSRWRTLWVPRPGRPDNRNGSPKDATLMLGRFCAAGRLGELSPACPRAKRPDCQDKVSIAPLAQVRRGAVREKRCR